MFTEEKRIFIELVSGCVNGNCTSPCFARDKEPLFMHKKIAEQLISNFKSIGIQVYLYGQGDSSVYPHFNEFPREILNGCIIVITQQNLNIVKSLKQSGAIVYVRLDIDLSDKDYDLIKMANGCFSIISMDNLELAITTAKKLLNDGMPFMLRSLCNTAKEVPSPERILYLMGRYKPKDIVRCILPETGCNVTTIREEPSKLLIKKCILHDQEEEYKQDLSYQWDPVINPEDFCFECNKNDDYRLYYDPVTWKSNG